MGIAGNRAHALYSARPFAAGHPAIEAHELDAKTARHREDAHETVDDVLACVRRAVGVPRTRGTAAVVGCGPLPRSVRRLAELGYESVGVEPVGEFVANARAYLGRAEAVMQGSAECLPLEDGSQSLILMESVIEHVDSPRHALHEAYRALAPGGVLYACTTNRLAVTNGEFIVPLFQWFPTLVKESYIHQHLHFQPALASYTSRPAVHWFSYADLCRLGRAAGFYRFYSKLDLMSTSDYAVRRSWLRVMALDRMRYNPWLRSLALTQKGNTIFMLKRPRP